MAIPLQPLFLWPLFLRFKNMVCPLALRIASGEGFIKNVGAPGIEPGWRAAGSRERKPLA
jgi:hypothetical protein